MFEFMLKSHDVWLQTLQCFCKSENNHWGPLTKRKKMIFLFAYHLISLPFLISLIARGFLFYGKIWVASKYTSGSKLKHEENEGACASLTVKLWAKQTLHFIIVKVHKACSGFMKSASCWQVLFWQSWENCLTKR